MIRKLFSAGHDTGQGHGVKRNFEIQRIETFSDGVFAFAITLLIVSLEVPQTFEELLTKMRGFFVFGLCFLVLVSIWNNQHLFFRRYGMDDSWTVVLNGILLFIVLFYVYPLKFLFTLVFGQQIYKQQISPLTIKPAQLPILMIIYAAGFIIIYFLFFLMHVRAYRKSKELGLSPVEKFDCKSSIYKESVMIGGGLCSILAALLLKNLDAGYAGFVYILISPAIHILYKFRNKTRRKLF
jgi:hypothetical protein